MSQVLATEAEVLTLSPDAASTKAAQGLVKPAKWPLLGQNDQTVWGHCQGSGSQPYQTQVDLSSPSFKCSCPSRKFPCKHGLALLLLRSQGHVATAEPPLWVQEWLESRKGRTEKKEANQAAKVAKAADPKAAAKKETLRWHKAQTGLQELALWLQDTLDQGLARLSQNHTWATQTAHHIAAHMVDAQIPALKSRLEHIVDLIDVHPQWPQEVFIQLCYLQLALDAAARWDENQLDDNLKAKLTQYLGWSTDKAEVMAQGEAIVDTWHVIGSRHLSRDTMTERHIWLQGLHCERVALLLDFSYQNRGFEQSFSLGQAHQGTVHFYHGSHALRAIVGTDFKIQDADTHVSPQHPVIAQSWQHITPLMTHNPWQHLLPLWIAGGSLQRWQEHWHIVFDDGPTQRAIGIVLSDDNAWRLLAQLQASQRLYWFGEWHHNHFQVLSVWQQAQPDDGLTVLWRLPKEFEA